MAELPFEVEFRVPGRGSGYQLFSPSSMAVDVAGHARPGSLGLVGVCRLARLMVAGTAVPPADGDSTLSVPPCVVDAERVAAEGVDQISTVGGSVARSATGPGWPSQ